MRAVLIVMYDSIGFGLEHMVNDHALRIAHLTPESVPTTIFIQASPVLRPEADRIIEMMDIFL